MLRKMKKFVSIMLCTALLLALVAVPAAADEGTGTLTYLINEDFDGSATLTHFGGGGTTLDFGGTHGKVKRIWCDAKNYVDDKTTYVSSSATFSDVTDPLVLSFDINITKLVANVALQVGNEGSSTNNLTYLVFGDDGGIWMANGGVDISVSAKTAACGWDKTKAKQIGSYTPNEWHNITIIYNYTTSGMKCYYLINGGYANMAQIGGNANHKLNWVKFRTLQGKNDGELVLFDNVRLFKVNDTSFFGEVTQQSGNIIVNTTMANTSAFSDWAAGPQNAFGTANDKKTQLIDCYTGNSIDYDIISQTGKQFVIKPKTSLNAGADYLVKLPEDMTSYLFGKKLAFTDIRFTAEPYNVTEIVNDSCSTENKFACYNPNGYNMTYTIDGGVLKIVNTGVTQGLNINYGTTSGFDTDSETSRYLDASIDFKVDTQAYYGAIIFSFGNKLQVPFTIRSNGRIAVGAPDLVGDAYEGKVGNLCYNIGSWNTVGVRYDNKTDTFTAIVNGREADLSGYLSSMNTTQFSDKLKIYYYTQTASADATTTLYLDNVYVANSKTGVENISVSANNIWTKGVISATETVATVNFDDAVVAEHITDDNITITDENGADIVAEVKPVLANEGDTQTTQAIVTVNNEMLSGVEYTINVSNIYDAYGAKIAPYAGKFTTKDVVISDFKLVNADDTAIEGTPSSVKATATVDGRVNGIIFIAQYNDDKLTGITPVTDNTLSGNASTAEYTIRQADGNLTLKAFIWDNVDSLRPLCDAVTYPNN